MKSKEPLSKCYANDHMTPLEFSLWSLLRTLSFKSNFNYRFDDRTLAAAFGSKRFIGKEGVSKDTINRARRCLVKGGWIQWLEPWKYDPHDQKGRLGHVLSTDEYLEQYPERCLPSVSSEGHTSVSNGGIPSVSSEGHILNKYKYSNKGKKRPSCKDSNARAVLPQKSPASVSSEGHLEPSVSSGGHLEPKATPKGDIIAPPILSELPASVQRLGAFLESRVGVKQRLYELENLDQIAKLTPEQAEQVGKWTTEDGFWGSKILGKTALITFCRLFPTISYKFQQELKAQKKSQNSKQLSELKAESVAPNPEKPFPYSGEVI